MSHWQDAITDSFPPPHEREPSNLRDDIRDELADHLECATRRELLKARDESAARQAALEQFGDPKSIARRLWWDGMKGRIMKDRLFIVLFTFGVIALLAAVVMPWAAKQNQINEAILAKLNAVSAPPVLASRPALPENWASVKVMFHDGGSTQPVKGAHVYLEGKPFADIDKSTLSELTDDQGVVRFGPIRPGPYQLRAATTPVDSDLSLGTSQSITLYAGQERQVGLARPVTDITSQLTVHINGPDYLQKLGCVSVCRVGAKEAILVDGTNWSPNFVSRFGIPIGGDRWGEVKSLMESRESGINDSTVVLMEKTFPMRWTAGVYQVLDITIAQPVTRGTAHSGVALGRYEPKDLFFEAKPGASRWEFALPDELIQKACRSDQLEVPMIWQFPEAGRFDNDGLIEVSYRFKSLEGGDARPGNPRSARFEPSISTILLTLDGRRVLRDQLDSIPQRRPPSLNPNVHPEPERRAQTSPELATDPLKLPVGDYEVLGYGLWKKQKPAQAAKTFELCTRNVMNPTYRMEIRANRNNVWQVQLPKEILEQCGMTATRPE